MYSNPADGLDPIRCYEDLRKSILEDPLYISRGNIVLQTRGMLCWFKSVNILNTWIANDELPAVGIMISEPSCRGMSDDGFRGRLRTVLADIADSGDRVQLNRGSHQHP